MPKKSIKSLKLFKKLSAVTPGGVNSPFRSFHEMQMPTLIFLKGNGSKIWDIDGNCCLDYLGAWGPAILGHAHPEVIKEARKAIEDSPVLGVSTPWEFEMASLVQKAFPSMEMIRFVNSGAEAVEAAIRLARGGTKRSLLVRFEGGYHGHGDSVLWTYGPEEHHPIKETGVPKGMAEETVCVPFNDFQTLDEVFKKQGEEIAALLVEPITGSMGVILPQPGFLEKCRELTTQVGAILIFDEVLTGFRVALGGAQERFKIKADLTCLGKILGGGFPAGAYGGRKDLMEKLAPLGYVYQAGTFSGNPITMRAGACAVRLLSRTGVYEKLEKKTKTLLSGIKQTAEKKGIPVQTPHAGSLFSILFSEKPVLNFQDSLKIDVKRYLVFFQKMLENGILFPPSASDAAVVSLAHTSIEIEQTITIFSKICNFSTKKLTSGRGERI